MPFSDYVLQPFFKAVVILDPRTDFVSLLVGTLPTSDYLSKSWKGYYLL